MSRSTVVVIDQEQVVHGQTNADIRVVSGGRLIQHGQLNGNVLVEGGGSLDQHGQVNGNVRALADAHVELWGQVNGELQADEGSDFRIAEGVMVLGTGQHRYVTPEGTWQALTRHDSTATKVGSTMWRLTRGGELEALAR